jgi:cob(I)alamin adenosyltransferase
MVRINKVYTRTGDSGSGGLVDGSRISKSSLRMTAVGEVDEANAVIGLALSQLSGGGSSEQLVRIQNELFDLGADVATPGEIEGALRIVPEQVARLEIVIDDLNAELPALTSFILPSGSAGVSSLHLARTVVRRAERAAVALNEREPLNPHLLAYLNRLSDFLFVAARHLAASEGDDVHWQPAATRKRRRRHWRSGLPKPARSRTHWPNRSATPTRPSSHSTMLRPPNGIWHTPPGSSKPSSFAIMPPAIAWSTSGSPICSTHIMKGKVIVTRALAAEC